MGSKWRNPDETVYVALEAARGITQAAKAEFFCCSHLQPGVSQKGVTFPAGRIEESRVCGAPARQLKCSRKRSCLKATRHEINSTFCQCCAAVANSGKVTATLTPGVPGGGFLSIRSIPSQEALIASLRINHVSVCSNGVGPVSTKDPYRCPSGETRLSTGQMELKFHASVSSTCPGVFPAI